VPTPLGVFGSISLLAPSENCPLSPCIKMLSPAWTLEIFYFLAQKPMHYGQLRRALGVSAKVLTARLRKLEMQSIVNRKILPTNPPMVEYSLSKTGRKFLPILDAFSDVSQKLQDEDGLFNP